ncbi:MAG: hypothetical protein H0W09_03320 [Solirubrobacterales bacterium]|nr:hypothetical protein [Solirubrobacterales bacterium]
MIRGPGIGIERKASSGVGRVVLILLALLALWYGLMTILLAVGVDPGTVNLISGYRTAYDFLAGLTPDEISGLARGVAAGAGILAFLLFGALALRMLPRPYRTRGDVDVDLPSERGATQVEPKALERIAKIASSNHGSVSSASARYSADALAVGIKLAAEADLAGSLEAAQQRVRGALEQHGLEVGRIDVTLTGIDTKCRRELA